MSDLINQMRNLIILQANEKQEEIVQDNLQIESLILKRERHKAELRELNHRLNELNVGINKLSFELMAEIFKWLNVIDLLNCEQVCSTWNQIIRYRLDRSSLVLIDRLWDRSSRWFYRNKYYESDSIAHVSLLSHILKATQNEQSFINNLRNLRIDNEDDCFNGSKVHLDLDSLKFVNKLVNLESFEIMFVQLEDRLPVITLPNLRSLEMQHIKSKSIKIDAPKLTSFKTTNCDDLKRVQFVYPYSLTHLYLTICDSSIERFSELKFLFCKNNVNIGILEKLSNLEELMIWYDKASNGPFNQVKNNVLQILEEKKRTNRTNPRLTFCGVVIEDANQLTEYVLGDNLIEFQMNNFEFLSHNVKWLSRIDYSRLYETFPNYRLDHSNFFDKFAGVRELGVNQRVINRNDLLGLLRHLYCLQSLKFVNAHLDEKFFQSLPTNLHRTLQSLQIKDNFLPIDDLLFLLKFNYLVSISTDYSVKLHIICEAFNRFDANLCFEFMYATRANNHRIEIKRITNTKYRLIVNRNPRDEIYSGRLQEFIELLLRLP